MKYSNNFTPEIKYQMHKILNDQFKKNECPPFFKFLINGYTTNMTSNEQSRIDKITNNYVAHAQLRAQFIRIMIKKRITVKAIMTLKELVMETKLN